MRIEGILNSNEYKCKLEEHLTMLLKKAVTANTEADVAFAFESEIYYFVRSVFNIELICYKLYAKKSREAIKLRGFFDIRIHYF